jgi:uncharacterized protein YdaU (DUF1376 family)
LHYYHFNIGDYRKDTVHLSRLEHYIYRNLIDWYYLDECPIPLETQSVARRLRLETEDEQKSLIAVLQDFFFESKEGWRHKRIDADIEKYHSQCATNRTNGKNGGRPKKEKNPLGYESEPNGNPTVTLTNNHKPITNNQIKTKPDRLPAVCCPEGLSADLFKEFKAVRKTPLTQRVLDKIRAEAESIGWTLEQALEKCVSRGWKSFEAEWVKEKQSPQVLSFAERDELAKRKRWEEMTGRPWPTEGEVVQRLEVL